MSRMKRGKTFLAGILAAALLAVPAHAQEESIRISSYKGDTLPVGVRSGLMIGPNKDAAQTVISSDPAVVTIENVQGFWVAVTQAEGTATITATGKNGETASVALTVSNPTQVASPPMTESALPNTTPAAPQPDSTEPTMENAEVRLELVRLINEVRQENGAPELTINQSLMDAAQEHAARQYTTHHRKEECETALAHGYPHGFACNLTAFTNAVPDEIAQRAVRNWRNSPGHFRVMIDPDNIDVGVGVVTVDGWTYCYLFLGEPGSYNPYG